MNSSPTCSFKEFYGLKNDRESFSVAPETDPELLVGQHHQQYFEKIKNNLLMKFVQQEGYKAVLYGDFGFGKTHFLHHLKYILENDSSGQFAIKPVYIKCNAFPKKASFLELWPSFINNIDPDYLYEITNKYLEKIESGTAKTFWELSNSAELATAFEVIGTFQRGKPRYNAVRWLRGEKLSPAELDSVADLLSDGEISGSVTTSQQFTSILNILSTMTLNIKGEVLLYLIDESERFENVSEIDAYNQWLACLREFTSNKKVGIIFAVGAGSMDEVPDIFKEDEVVTRISIGNIIELMSMNEQTIEDFIKGFLSEMIDVSSAEATKALAPGSYDPNIWPFTDDGFREFVSYHSEFWQPREIIHGLQKVTGQAYLDGLERIDQRFVEKVLPEIY